MTRVLVTGATGNVGSHVVRELGERGKNVRAFVRDPGKAAGMFGDESGGGVEIVPGDFADAASVTRAMDGAGSVFLACSNQPRQVEYETRVIDAAREAGVRRIVKLSALGAEAGSPVAFWDWHARIEKHLRASGTPHVILRPGFSMSNLPASAEATGRTGMMFLPAGEASVAMIDPRDVAAVAAAALTGDGHDGRIHTLTGPEATSFERVAEELSAAVGRRVQYVSVPDEAAKQGMIEQGLPEFVAGQIVAVFGFLRNGAQDRTTGTVRELTGREPRSFARFARDHAGPFRYAGDVGEEVPARTGP